MDDLSFLADMATEDSTATLIVLLPDNAVSQIHNVSPFAILEKCPLLYHAFEFGANSVRQANIEASSASAVICLLRYLYTDDYLPGDEQGHLINHAEVFRIAEDYDLPALQVLAYVNFSQCTEYACCFAVPPPDLCQTIRFIYEHLSSTHSRQEQSLLDTLLHYCLSMLTYQQLSKHADFRQVIWDLPAFHKDLCRKSMQRNFEDDGASDLVCLPAPYTTTNSTSALDKRALGDIQYELLQDLQGPYADLSGIPEADPAEMDQDNSDHPILVLRSKNPEQIAEVDEHARVVSESESSSDESGFTLVHRPRSATNIMMEFEYPASVPSSPEMIGAPSPPKDTTFESLTDEEWDFVDTRPSPNQEV